MTTQQLVYFGIVFLAAFGVALVVIMQLAPNRVKDRLEQIVKPDVRLETPPESAWVERVTRIAAPLAKLSVPAEGWEKSPLRLRFIHAGYSGRSPIPLFFGAKTFFALAFPGVMFFYFGITGKQFPASTFLLMMLLTAAIGYYLPNVVLARKIESRQLEIFENFPDAIDLLLVCIEAGLGLDAALARIAEEMAIKSQALAQELHMVTLELRAGSSREKALRNLAMRTGIEQVDMLVAMLVQADRFGTSIGDSLRVHAEDLRSKRRLRAEEMAAKVPLKLLFPLIFFIFPALLLVLLGPAFLQISKVLIPVMSGTQ